jgi:GxxExxY protein
MELVTLNELTYKIRGAIFKVHTTLAPGSLESVYVAALSYELSLLALSFRAQLGLPVENNGIVLEFGFRIDILVNDESSSK